MNQQERFEMSKEREKVTCKTELEFITEVAEDCVANLKDKDREYLINNPFDGLFFMTGKRHKYTVNHTIKIYYSLDETDILFQNHTKNDFSDPLPLLLGYGRIKEPGEWIGDIIGVSDQRPEGYSLMKEIYVDW